MELAQALIIRPGVGRAAEDEMKTRIMFRETAKPILLVQQVAPVNMRVIPASRYRQKDLRDGVI